VIKSTEKISGETLPGFLLYSHWILRWECCNYI